MTPRSGRGRARWLRAAGLVCLLGAIGSPAAHASTPTSGIVPPRDLTVKDRPGDSGGSVLITWTDPDSTALLPGSVIEVRRSEPAAPEWTTLAVVPIATQRYEDASAESGRLYRYEIRTRSAGRPAPFPTDTLVSAGLVSAPVSAHDNWFRARRTNSLIATIIFLIAVLSSIRAARSGKPIFIRKIAGLNAVDEAIGRATETGKKVLFVPGIGSMDDIQTVASMSILGHVARATARNGTDLDVANRDPLTFASARTPGKLFEMPEASRKGPEAPNTSARFGGVQCSGNLEGPACSMAE